MNNPFIGLNKAQALELANERLADAVRLAEIEGDPVVESIEICNIIEDLIDISIPSEVDPQ